MSIILTLMRTNASMIEVNVSSSASAMSPQPYSRTGLFPRKARDSLCPSCRWEAALHGPGLMNRRGRFAPPPPHCPFARCVLLRTRRLSAAVCLEATGRGGIRWGGAGDAKATNHTSNPKIGFCWCYITLMFIHLNAIIFTLHMPCSMRRNTQNRFMRSSFISVSLTSCRCLKINLSVFFPVSLTTLAEKCPIAKNACGLVFVLPLDGTVV